MTNENKPTIQDDPGAPESQFAEGMHPDQHALVFSPANAGGTEQVLVGSDGGVVRTSGAFADDSARCDQRQADKPADGKFSPEELALCKQALSAVPTRIDSLNDGLATIQFHPGQRHVGVHRQPRVVRVDRRRRRPVCDRSGRRHARPHVLRADVGRELQRQRPDDLGLHLPAAG